MRENLAAEVDAAAHAYAAGIGVDLSTVDDETFMAFARLGVAAEPRHRLVALSMQFDEQLAHFRKSAGLETPEIETLDEFTRRAREQF